MKITLLQTPWSDSSAREYKGIAKRYALYPPLGLMCLAASVEEAGHESDIIDLEVEEISIDGVCDRIRDFGSEIIGITATTPVYHVAVAFAKAIKERINVKVIIGGPHVNVLKEEVFEEAFDYLVYQEGQETLVEMMDIFEGGGELDDIKGLIWRDGDGSVVVNKERPFAKNLDDLPLPLRHKVDPENYFFEVPGKGVIPVATIELTRGCPFKCVFCSEPLNTGKVLRRRTPKSVVDEMLVVREEFGITHFMTLDSTLTLNRKLIEGLCHEIINRGANVTWEGQTRSNLVDEELLVLMKRAGMVRLSFGLESGNPEVLRLMKKELDPDSMRMALALCKKLGISTMCGTMMGNPGDTRKTMLQTAFFIRSIPEIRYAPVGIAIPYPGTELAFYAENNMHGLKLLSKDYRMYSRYAGGVMEIDGMSPKEMVRLQRHVLVISHATPRKVIGLMQHFGVLNVFKIAWKQLCNEIIVLFGGDEPALQTHVVDDNTTLKSLGMGIQNNYQLAPRE